MKSARVEADCVNMKRACDKCRRKKIKCEGPMNSNSANSV